MKQNKAKLAFSLIELSVVILVIGILVIGITKGTSLMRSAKLQSAQSLTKNSPVSVIDGLKLWLESTSDKSFNSSEKTDGGAGGNGTITKWYDINPQYSNGLSADQSTAANMPIYTSNAINGLPALKFAGNDWIRATIPMITSETLEVFTVCKRIAFVSNTSSASFHRGLTGSDNDSVEELVLAWERAVVANNRLEAYRANVIKSAKAPHPGNNIPYIFSTRFDGTNNTSYYNGVAQTPFASTGNFGFDNILVGGRWDSGAVISMFNGYIGELIIFNRSLTATERKDVTKYLGDKWGIEVQ
ncbi:MAG: hypothetical protein K0R25_1395 [Rickettsiaceae bacterium]|jgi:prepilin-type N-terminal cleavage/methylation domain-containing protein|nr:hypothetical protein [Rickettsiaceae bacterium]